MLKKFIKININSCSNWSRILIDFQSFLTRPSVTTKRIPNFLLVPWARNLLSLHSFSYSFHLPRFLFPVLHLQEPIVITPPHHFFWEMVEANNGSSFLTSTISFTFRLVLHLSEVLSIINLIETFLTTFLRFLWSIQSRKVHGRLNASWKISSLAVNGQSFLVIDGYLLNPEPRMMD